LSKNWLALGAEATTVAASQPKTPAVKCPRATPTPLLFVPELFVWPL